jgi:molybdopterin converting factor small subunit
VDLDGKAEVSVSDVLAAVEKLHPRLKERKLLTSVAVAVNLEYVDLVEGRVKAGDEVAIIPPVSGG